MTDKEYDYLSKQGSLHMKREAKRPTYAQKKKARVEGKQRYKDAVAKQTCGYVLQDRETKLYQKCRAQDSEEDAMYGHLYDVMTDDITEARFFVLIHHARMAAGSFTYEIVEVPRTVENEHRFHV